MSATTSIKWEAAKQADSATQASKVVNALTIQLNGTSQGAYNGSAAKTINITASSVGAAASSHTHNYLPLSGGSLTGVLKEGKGTYVHYATGTAGKTGYVIVADIKITNEYQNIPLGFEVYRRGNYEPTRLYITFEPSTSNDPGLARFYYEGAGTSDEFQIRKNGTSNWYLYIKKTEGYDNIGITEFRTNFNYMKGISVAFTNVGVASVPSGATKASLLRHAAASVPNNLVIQLNGTTAATYNGTTAKTVNITPASIGAATSGHSHSNYAAKNHGHDNYFQYRGGLTSESQLNNCTTVGWWYVNGAKLSVVGNSPWYGKLRVTGLNGNDGTIQQELVNAWSYFIRDYSGSPAKWTQWIRVDRPIQTIEQNYGTATISSGNAHVFAEHTINYSGLWLICACSYAIGDFPSAKTSGVFQAGVSVNGVSWLCGNQSLNSTIARPGVGGTIILHLNKGDKLRHRVYFGCTPHGSISTHYNCLTACNLTQD